MSAVAKVTTTSSKIVSSQTMTTSSVKSMKASSSTVKKSTFSSDGQSSTSVQSSSQKSMMGSNTMSVQQSGVCPEDMQKLMAAPPAAGAGKNTVVSQQKSTTSSSKMVSQSMQSFSSNNVAVQSSGHGFLESAQKDFEQLKLDVDARMKKLREEFNLMSLSNKQDTIKLDSNNIQNFTDKSGAADKFKFNFDVSEMQSETIDVKCDGNKIEVKAKKLAKSGDDESTEEFSRTYELPQGSNVDPQTVTSSCFKDGVLTVELPAEACVDLKQKSK